MKQLLILSIVFSLLMGSNPVSAKQAQNAPYVHSDLDGVFYARCIPSGASGSSGKTDIFHVKQDKDELVDSYQLYCKDGVRLGWSPIAGKVAVLMIHPTEDESLDKQVELSFYLGGKKLTQYSTADLQKLGATVVPDMNRRKRARFQVWGSRQVPGTNEYNFVIDIDGKQVAFDILTGKQRAVPKDWQGGNDKNNAWLSDRINEAKSIKPGMSRSALLKVFDVEGGLQSMLPTRYVLKSCPMIKVDVTFKKTDNNKAKDDEIKIATVSQVYIDHVICD